MKPTPTTQQRAGGRILEGVVVSDKMTKTVVVQVLRLRQHPIYKKFYKVTKRFKAHDEQGQYHVGDHVFIQESRPLSREKRWVVIGKTDDKSKVESS